MAGHAVGNQVVMTGTIVKINGAVALVRVDRGFPEGATIAVRLGMLSDDAASPDEDLIRRTMKKAQKRPGRKVTVK